MGETRGEAQREVESKFDVHAGWMLPNLARLVPDGRVAVERVHLVSTYYDTADQHLLANRLTLRRRTGDIDTGWQLKVPDGDARVELRWPLQGRSMPSDIRDVTLGVRGRAALAAVATLDVRREIHRLHDVDGTALAEVVLDAVTATRAGGVDVPTSWTEVEVELIEGGHGLLRRADRLLRDAGATRSASASKLGRALAAPPAVTYPKGSLARLVARYLDRQWETLVRGDLDLRRGEEPIHAIRIAVRRYRSVLRVLRPAFDADRRATLDAELAEFAAVLGLLRDNEVLRAYLTDLIAGLPDELDAGAAGARITNVLDADREDARASLVRRLRSRRHLALLADLRAWHADLPVDVTRPAKDAVHLLARADRVAAKRLATVPARPEVGDERMHRARKAARRTRYAAELVALAGKKGRRAAHDVGRRGKAVQQRLGSRQDAVVAAEFLLRVGADVDADSSAFALGVLYERARERTLLPG